MLKKNPKKFLKNNQYQNINRLNDDIFTKLYF